MIAALRFNPCNAFVTKKGHAFASELEEQVPELATRDGIDARGRLIEKKARSVCAMSEQAMAKR